ncbi:transferase family hexapeptide repeat protein [Rivibacter subsaxonicus]|uniref:Transferase family hexapeptide repeat protein n=2 Tax=Rivibacter subsaxonicus TaxID=457575 RepID=A0A4Q7VGR9_9BURK|nr:transferase family hexapeptide repeat protein [Rivibacter subsaxonicus]
MLEADVIVGPNAVFVEPGSSADGAAAQVQRGVRIGANATIHSGITLATGAVVRPGAVVTRSVPPAAIVEGNPAVITGYVDTDQPRAGAGPALIAGTPQPIEATSVRGVTVHSFPVINDLRGNLTVGEFGRQIPFHPLRYFMVFGVPNQEIRGEHAHRECHQFLVCVRGRCCVVADDGVRRVEVTLDMPSRGLHLPPMTWGIQYKYSADALLLVFASHHYDPADYIRDYGTFLRAVARDGQATAGIAT